MTFTELCRHHHNPIWECFHHCKRALESICCHSLVPPPSPRWPWICLQFLEICLFRTSPVNGLFQYVAISLCHFFCLSDYKFRLSLGMVVHSIDCSLSLPGVHIFPWWDLRHSFIPPIVYLLSDLPISPCSNHFRHTSPTSNCQNPPFSVLVLGCLWLSLWQGQGINIPQELSQPMAEGRRV